MLAQPSTARMAIMLVTSVALGIDQACLVGLEQEAKKQCFFAKDWSILRLTPS
jgi:hypothetical protein